MNAIDMKTGYADTMACGDSYSVMVRRSNLGFYVWAVITILEDSGKIIPDVIATGHKDTQNAAWLAGIKAAKEYQRQVNAERKEKGAVK